MDSPNQEFEIQLLGMINDGHRWKNVKVQKGAGDPCSGNMYTTKGGGYKITTFKSYDYEVLQRMHIQTFGFNSLLSYAHVVVYWHRMHPNTSGVLISKPLAERKQISCIIFKGHFMTSLFFYPTLR